MKDIQLDQEQKIEINTTEILTKYKSIDDRKLFCFEKNLWKPEILNCEIFKNKI